MEERNNPLLSKSEGIITSAVVLCPMLIWCVPVISLPLCGGLLVYSLGIAIDFGFIINLLLGIVFLMIGNYLPKGRINDSAAAKSLKALESEDVRYRSQRFMGWCYALMGICFFINCILQNKTILISVIVLSILIPLVCSIVAGRNYIKNN